MVSVTRFYKVHRKFGNHWTEYKDPIHLIDHPSIKHVETSYSKHVAFFVSLELLVLKGGPMTYPM